VGDEMKKQARQFGSQFRESSSDFSRNMSSGQRPRQGIGHAIGVLFKAFFLFIAAIITFALVMALIGVMFTGAGILPLKNYLLSGFWENVLAWGAVLLFLVLPVVALLTWLIRRIIGVRRGGNYLGYIFGSLWVIGLICFLSLIGSVSSDFRTRSGLSEEISMQAPVSGRLIVKMTDNKPIYEESDWMGINWPHPTPFFELNEDSLVLNTVRIRIEKSNDSAWHAHSQKLSRGNTTGNARNTASLINFNVQQRDSILYLPAGFSVRPGHQFRNQQIVVVIQVPVGKKIRMDRSLDDFYWFDLNNKSWRNHRYNRDWNDDWDDNSSDSYSWSSGVDYIMTEHGLERSAGSGNSRGSGTDKQQNKTDSPSKDGYRYRQTMEVKKVPKSVTAECNSVKENVSPLILFTKWS
jgi:hypothetical protein